MWLKRSIYKVAFTTIISFFMLNNLCFAFGLSTDFNDIFIENLQIGQEYNLTKFANLPVKVKNDSDKSVKIKIQPVIPSNLKEKFEVIPSTEWIKFTKTEIDVLPQEYAITDMIITIPDDTNYLGKKFQVNIWSYVVEIKGQGGLLSITPGVESRFFFSIAPIKNKQKIKTVDIDFELAPVELYSVVKTTYQYIGNFVVKNPSKKTARYEIRQISPQKIGMYIKEGYGVLPDNVLVLSQRQFRLKGKKSKGIDVYISLSAEEYQSGKFMSAIEVNSLGKDSIWRRFVKVFVELQ